MDHAQEIDQIRIVLQRHSEVLLGVLFGSLASGRAGFASDLDVAVEGPGPLSAEQRLPLIDELAVALGRPVDLIDFHRVGEPLLGEIVRKGILLVGNPSRLVEWRIRHLGNVDDFVPLQQRLLSERLKSWTGGL